MGLPVISTPQCGDVVRDGVDGYKVPTRDVAAIIISLEKLRDTAGALEALSLAALARSAEFGPETQYRKISGLA